jgi:GT2 family glycosyltransferase
MKKVAIIVLNWRQAALTLQTVSSLLKIKTKNFTYQIIIVDNGSGDDSLSLFKKKYSKNELVTILNTGVNLGYSGGNNFAIDYALKKEFDYLLLLNNDVLVDPNFLTQLLKEAGNYQILGPKIYFAPGFEYHKDRYQKKALIVKAMVMLWKILNSQHH